MPVRHAPPAGVVPRSAAATTLLGRPDAVLPGASMHAHAARQRSPGRRTFLRSAGLQKRSRRCLVYFAIRAARYRAVRHVTQGITLLFDESTFQRTVRHASGLRFAAPRKALFYQLFVTERGRLP